MCFTPAPGCSPTLTTWSNRRVKHHKDTLSHRDMVVFSLQYSGQMQTSLDFPCGNWLGYGERMFDSHLRRTCEVATLDGGSHMGV
ncbi:hypothetical protein HBI56_183280 [Parastagonospora nodorum]|uniref:Uncharacterized protein n=1 Tax=Phaeosphaeria nodorum (strain SN15 / ATCC MYA-4574 / FGSC 10173) TaxID=321614 RepID=A0A7U2FHG3_PHANO|nr:hypothetical protein HBH56_191760 [Parastagonospora nodorum]QRD03085.1 hypothetical protein JI435_419090 [Parastagonospora nodorum SN15]KAH3938221.1 hypothetical protein HBH54_010240 [Parastagonospora nodorum]KAH3977948.1 hypothetical protein HBH51_072020 [Parastagonospora nodorum]KAH3994269.1 hypothetical protein HBI10_189310 [Parastagonospora nodorum]